MHSRVANKGNRLIGRSVTRHRCRGTGFPSTDFGTGFPASRAPTSAGRRQGCNSVFSGSVRWTGGHQNPTVRWTAGQKTPPSGGLRPGTDTFSTHVFVGGQRIFSLLHGEPCPCPTRRAGSQIWAGPSGALCTPCTARLVMGLMMGARGRSPRSSETMSTMLHIFFKNRSPCVYTLSPSPSPCFPLCPSPLFHATSNLDRDEALERDLFQEEMAKSPLQVSP
jgi:hypothetical protein